MVVVGDMLLGVRFRGHCFGNINCRLKSLSTWLLLALSPALVQRPVVMPYLWLLLFAPAPVWAFSAANDTTLPGHLPVNTSAVVLALNTDVKAGEASYVVRFIFEWEDETMYQTVTEKTREVLNGTTTCKMYCSGSSGSCCDGIFPVELDNVNALGTPTVDTSLYFSATNSSVLQVSTMRGRMYNHVHMKSYPFGKVEWAMCNQLSITIPGLPSVPVLPLPNGSGATQAAMAPTPSGWELRNVNYYSGWQLKEAQLSGGTNYQAHRLGPARIYSYGQGRLDVAREAGDSMAWANNVIAQDAAFVLLTMESEVTARTTFSLVFPVCLLALMNVAIYLQDVDKYATRFTSANIVFLSASNFMTGSFMVGSRGLSAVQQLTVIVLAMLFFTVASSFVWFKLLSNRSVKDEFMDMWHVGRGKWRRLAELPSGEEDMKGGVIDDDSSKLGVDTPETGFSEHFRRDESFKLRLCILGDNLSMIITLIVYIVSFTLIIVRGDQYEERVIESWDVCQTQLAM